VRHPAEAGGACEGHRRGERALVECRERRPPAALLTRSRDSTSNKIKRLARS
jgi:hypothetical protein